MNRFWTCVYAALHVVALVVLWGAVYLACKASAGTWCVMAILAGLVFSAVILYSFQKALNRCLYGR